MILIATLTLGLLMNHPSVAESQIPGNSPHNGMSPQALERAYVESYKQSGFRLAKRHKQLYPNGGWTIELVFQLKSAPKGPDAPGTTLRLGGNYPAKCTCDVRRQIFKAADADSPDPAAVARGERALIKADRLALAKVRKRLGVSIPYAG
ncbi:hypothetical protein NC00_09345 [Xanthomonas cannabis pv. phaseoli]|uniref:Secreted protein n=1 Tax=Xanthomonas cannabis pv. phaseoli TaxID=1885902 RepID=A0AB34P914_9XANT|nr:hypothetical protein NC00_09345 [Xanthomonas cannabis pv. phaseoli]